MLLPFWVDCPRYRLPESYKSMPLADLIQDAFDQLRQNFGVTLPSVRLMDFSKSEADQACGIRNITLARVDCS